MERRTYNLSETIQHLIKTLSTQEEKEFSLPSDFYPDQKCKTDINKTFQHLKAVSLKEEKEFSLPSDFYPDQKCKTDIKKTFQHLKAVSLKEEKEFSLPSGFSTYQKCNTDINVTSETSIPKVKKRRKKGTARKNTRASRQKDKERKRNQRNAEISICQEKTQHAQSSRTSNLQKRKLLTMRRKACIYIAKKKEMRRKYGLNSDVRKRKLIYMRNLYKHDLTYQEKMKTRSKTKYKDDLDFQEEVKTRSKTKYKDDLDFQEGVKTRSKTKYKDNLEFQEEVKTRSKTKYKDDLDFQEKVKKQSITKYRGDLQFCKALKETSRFKYATDHKFREKIKRIRLLRYRENVLYREKLRRKMQFLYSCDLKLKQMKIQRVKKSRLQQKEQCTKSDQLADHFRSLVRDGPTYVCGVCLKFKFKKQVVQCDEAKYSEKGPKCQSMAFQCISHEFFYPCNSECGSICLNIRHKLWICFTCHRHLLKGSMPPDAQSNGLQLKDIPDELKSLNTLEKQLISLRIPFMKLVQLPKGCQRGIIGPCVSIPSDVESTTNVLPRTDDENQIIRCKLKRKLSYKGFSQYEFVNPAKIRRAVDNLKENNPFYHDILLNEAWVDNVADDELCVDSPGDIDEPSNTEEDRLLQSHSHSDPQVANVDMPCLIVDELSMSEEELECSHTVSSQSRSHIVTEKCPEIETSTAEVDCSHTVSSQSRSHIVTEKCQEKETSKGELGCSHTVRSQSRSHIVTEKNPEIETSKDNELDDDLNIKERGYPVDTCLQPNDIGQDILDQHFDDIFCLAPGEGQTPVSMLREEGNEAMSFPVQFPEGYFGSYDSKRNVRLTRAKYFHSRLMCADDRFSSDTSYLFYAQYLSELEQVMSKVSIALRKGSGKDSQGNLITAGMLTDKEKLKGLLTSDQGYKFMTPIRGTPPYWQTVLKELMSMIRQLGIPTWFATFSAADMRWTDILNVLMEQQQNMSSIEELDWNAKAKILKNNPVMSAVMFNHRFQTFLKEIIIKDKVIGTVKDHFHRIEFQQRGSPHAHCLFWIQDAPLIDKDDDETVCEFIDHFITCELPDKNKDPELHEIVSCVQQHSKNHSKSCKKRGTTCRFNFPRPPSEKTFISRTQSLTDPSLTKSPQELKAEAQTILQQLWTVINEGQFTETEITTQKLFSLAGITQEQFENASNILTKRTNTTLKRTPHDLWINQYNPTLLRCWNANMDIQYITDAYSCVMYIISYISKAEREMGMVMENARKEASDGNCDAQEAMKKISSSYFRQREVSAQEAAYRTCGLHLKECSRKVQFIPIGENQIKMSLPLNIIQSKTNELDENDIWMLSLYDRYKARPLDALFEEMCYASFCSEYRILSASQIPKNPEKCGVFKLQNDTGYIKKRTRTESAVVRYPRFSKEKSPEMYYQAILQLFLPHRLEAQLKPQQFTTFEEMYSNGAVILPVGGQPRNVKTIVEENRQLFEKNAEDLDKAQEMIDMNGPLEDAWALIAPETEAERLEGQQEREKHNEEDIMEIPELDNNNSQKSHGNDIELRQLAFPANVVKSLMRQMNKEQRDVFNKVRAWCIDTVNGKNPKPFQVFISGGAGTGKSHLIKCLFYESTRILSPLLPNPDDISVLLTASTAVAAFNIGGTTLHQCFSLPKCLPLPYVYLRDSQLNKLRSKFQHVFILIIDEISMVGQRVLLYISERLRQIKQSGNALFGNICVIAVGDFYQIPPVRQLSLWDCRPEHFFPLWSNCFSLVELKQIMRQKDDVLFAQLLNRLRVRRKNEPLSSDDLALLKSCESHTVPADTLHILSTLKRVTAHNNQMLETVCQTTVSIAALDLDKDAKTGQLTAREVPFETKSDSLPANLVIGLKAKVMLVRNINVANGLVNGAVGTVCEILPPKDRHSMPEGVMVLFDSERIHSDATNTNKHLPIKIEPFEETLSNGTVRHQFPLQLSWACTCHKVQGVTTDKAVVSLHNMFQAGMAYVALSRLTSIDGLVIKDFDEDGIYCNESIAGALQQMPLFLTDESTDNDNECAFTLVLHNVQGLHQHISDITCNTDLANNNILCMTETWLEEDSMLPTLPNYKLISKSRFGSYSRKTKLLKDLKLKKNGGVGFFVKESINYEVLFHDDCVDMECIGLFIKDIDVCLVLIYRPESYAATVFLKQLHKVVSSVLGHYGSVLVVGDFNQNLLHENSSIKTYFENNGFKQIVKDSTTDGNTLLDHVYTNTISRHISVKIIHTYYSYHNMVKLDISYS